MALRLLTLGSLELVNEHGETVGGTAAQQKPLLILALVALHPAGLARSALLRALWPGTPVARARAALKQHLYSLRRVTGEATLISGSPTLRISTAVLHVDAHEIAAAVAAGRLADAVEFFRGELLEGVDFTNTPELERMVVALREAFAPTAAHVRAAAAIRRATVSDGTAPWHATLAERLLEETVARVDRGLRTLPEDPVAAGHRAASGLHHLLEALHGAEVALVPEASIHEHMALFLAHAQRSGLVTNLQEAAVSGAMPPALLTWLIAGGSVTADPVGRAIENAVQRSAFASQYRHHATWTHDCIVRAVRGARRQRPARILLVGIGSTEHIAAALAASLPLPDTVIHLIDRRRDVIELAGQQLTRHDVTVAATVGDELESVTLDRDEAWDLVLLDPGLDRLSLPELMWLADRWRVRLTHGGHLCLAPATAEPGWRQWIRHVLGWPGEACREEDLLLLSGSPHAHAPSVTARRDPSGLRWLASIGATQTGVVNSPP